jgi:hypothetical protein
MTRRSSDSNLPVWILFAAVVLFLANSRRGDQCDSDAAPMPPKVGEVPYGLPHIRPLPQVDPDDKPNNGPSYPNRRPADRIDGEAIINVLHDRIRDRSPPFGVSV